MLYSHSSCHGSIRDEKSGVQTKTMSRKLTNCLKIIRGQVSMERVVAEAPDFGI